MPRVCAITFQDSAFVADTWWFCTVMRQGISEDGHKKEGRAVEVLKEKHGINTDHQKKHFFHFHFGLKPINEDRHPFFVFVFD